MDFLRCPDCKKELDLVTFDSADGEISEGIVHCSDEHFFPIVRDIPHSMRTITTRIPAPIFARIADISAIPFIGFCWTVNKLGIRKYETPQRREAALAVHDIFGAPYAHYHSFDEVSNWYNSVGITEIWACNDDRRGFGVCGKIGVEENNR